MQRKLGWLQEIPALNDLGIDRQYDCQHGSEILFYVEADASKTCVVAYLRFENDDIVKVFFLMGKTSVNPIKATTIQKLELQAALQASRIKVSMIEENDITIYHVFKGSDSSTVIQWLNAFEEAANFCC